MYPDGTLIDVFALDRPGGLLLTDLGETLGWLSMQSVHSRLNASQNRLAADACANLGVRLELGHLVLRGIHEEGLGEAVQRLALAAVRVSDLSFTLRGGAAKPDTHKSISRWLTRREIRFEQRVNEIGRSGRQWKVDYRTQTSDRRALVFLLSTGTTNAARRSVEHVLAGCVDLRHLKEHNSAISFVSLFDDTARVWRPEDFALVAQSSTVARWSRPAELETILRPADDHGHMRRGPLPLWRAALHTD